MSGPGRSFDVLVIGAGLSGLMAAALLVERGAQVGVIAKGGGFFHFTTGCIDVLGRDAMGRTIEDPLAAVDGVTRQQRDHPYARAGTEELVTGVDTFRSLMAAADLPFVGDLHVNMTMPTAIGSTRPTCLVPEGMVAGNLRDSTPILIVGFRHFRDFYPPYLAANLSRCFSGEVRHLYLDMPSLRGRRHLLSLDVARAFDDRAFREEVGRLVVANLGRAARVGFPAVLGLETHWQTVAHLQEIIGRPVFEIPTLPPSVPGIRIYQALRRHLLRRGVRIEVGFWVRGRIDGGRATEMVVESAGRPTTHQADAFILATGGTGSGGIAAHTDGSLRETVFDLAVQGPPARTAWYRPQFLGPDPQPITLAGVETNERLQPYTQSGDVVPNIVVTASNLPHWEPVHEGSGEGVALATAQYAADEVLALLGSPRSAAGIVTAPPR